MKGASIQSFQILYFGIAICCKVKPMLGTLADASIATGRHTYVKPHEATAVGLVCPDVFNEESDSWLVQLTT